MLQSRGYPTPREAGLALAGLIQKGASVSDADLAAASQTSVSADQVLRLQPLLATLAVGAAARPARSAKP